MSYRGAGTILGPLRFEGTAPPDISALGEGRVYFDSTSNTFRVSQNAGAYVNLLGLQSNYENGPTINTSTAVGPVTLSGQDANDDSVLQIDKTPVGAQMGQAINVSMGANATGDGIRVANDGIGVGIRSTSNFATPAASFISAAGPSGVQAVEGSFSRSIALDPNSAAIVYSAGVSQFAGDAAGSSVVAYLSSAPVRDVAANSFCVANLVLNDPTGVGSYDFSLLGVFDDLVIGAIDPLGSTVYVQCISPLRLSTGVSGAPPYVVFDDGALAPVSLAATGSLRYSDTSKQIEQSIDGGPWALVGTPAVTTVTGAVVLADVQAMVFADSSGGAFAITLASAAAVAAGSKVTIKDSGGTASANNITLTPPGAETIDGAASYVMSVDYESVDLVSNGTNWFLI